MSNVYAWPVDAVTVPAFVVGYPTTMTLGATFGRGSDELVLPVWYVIGGGQTSTPDVRDQLGLAIGAAPSITETLAGPHSFGAVLAGKADITSVTIGAISYIAIRWDLDMVTPGPMDLKAIMVGIAALITVAGL